MTGPKIITVTLNEQMDLGLIEDTRLTGADALALVDMATERPICSAMMHFGTRYRYRKGGKRYTRSKPTSQRPCTMPATRVIQDKYYCSNHGPGRYFTDPYYDSPSWRELRQATLDRDNHTCFYCGNKAYQADHVLPRTKGGVDDLSNTVACCARCNRIARNAEFSSKDAKRNWIRSQITLGTRKKDQRPVEELLLCSHKDGSHVP